MTKDELMVIPMPLDSEGRGPASEADTVRTIWQVWDGCWATVAEFASQEEAESFIKNW